MLSTMDRPQVVGRWINGGRKTTPIIDDLPAFIMSWKAWWLSLQPDSRVQQGSKLRQVHVTGEKWEKLSKGGINGFFNIVVSLSWWWAAVKSSAQRKVFMEMLEDVSWVQDQVISSLQQGQVV